ncbi:MAG: hemolysin III family protein [Planctomycetota bacterium]
MQSTLAQREEWANVVTHGVGLALAVAACVYLPLAANSLTHAMTGLVFGIGLVCCYATSTGFHAAAKPQRKLVWRQLDHAAIYVLIAATYFAVLPFAPGGMSGWIMAGVVWAIAAVGMLRKFLMLKRGKSVGKLDLAIYIALGWIWILAAVPIYSNLSTPAFLWLLAGGLAYTVGAIFFRLERLPYNHAVWHVFVLAGSAGHFIVVAFFR